MFVLRASTTNPSLDGSVYYSTHNVSLNFAHPDCLLTFFQGEGVTFQSGEDLRVRNQFVTAGVLQNTQDTDFRAVSDDWPVFAMSWFLGEVNTKSDPVIISIGHVRDPAVQYVQSDGSLQNRSLYFWTEFNTVSDAVSFCFEFLQNVSYVLSRLALSWEIILMPWVVPTLLTSKLVATREQYHWTTQSCFPSHSDKHSLAPK